MSVSLWVDLSLAFMQACDSERSILVTGRLSPEPGCLGIRMRDQTHISLTKVSHMATPNSRGGGVGRG